MGNTSQKQMTNSNQLPINQNNKRYTNDYINTRLDKLKKSKMTNKQIDEKIRNIKNDKLRFKMAKKWDQRKGEKHK
jgi:hypothetical protein